MGLSMYMTCHRRVCTYGMVYGMYKTTIYLPEDLKHSISEPATARGVSEAELIREALRMVTARSAPLEPFGSADVVRAKDDSG